MKKSTVLLISFLFVGISSFPQTTSIGIFGGTNISSINGTYFAHSYGSTIIKSHTGMQVGLAFDYTLTEALSLYCDPAYIQKGFKYDNYNDKGVIGGAAFHGENRFQYIHLPLTLKLKLFKSKIFYIRSGLYLSFLLRADITDEFHYAPNPSNPPPDYTDEKINNELNSSTLGFVMGTGVGIPLSSKLKLIIDVAYMMDVTNALKDKPPAYIWYAKDGIYATVENVKNRTVAFSLGITYQFKAKN